MSSTQSVRGGGAKSRRRSASDTRNSNHGLASTDTIVSSPNPPHRMARVARHHEVRRPRPVPRPEQEPHRLRGVREGQVRDHLVPVAAREPNLAEVAEYWAHAGLAVEPLPQPLPEPPVPLDRDHLPRAPRMAAVRMPSPAPNSYTSAGGESPVEVTMRSATFSLRSRCWESVVARGERLGIAVAPPRADVPVHREGSLGMRRRLGPIQAVGRWANRGRPRGAARALAASLVACHSAR